MREAIYLADTGIMQSVRMGIFNLTPRYGVAADSGAIFEMGYMVGKDHALGRRPMVFGFSTKYQSLAERECDWQKNPQGPSYGNLSTYSDPSTVYSIMIDGAIAASNGSKAHRPTKAEAQAKGLAGHEQYANLEEFERCITLAAQQFVHATEQQVPQTSHPFGASPHTLWQHNSQFAQESFSINDDTLSFNVSIKI